MKSRSLLACAALLSASLAMAACSTSSTAQNGTTTTTATGTSTSTSGSTSNSSGSSALAMNVQVTDAVRTQLVAAAAGLNSIPVAEFTGLAPGLTFYALDKETNIHWAGARLVPAPSSNPSSPTQAQISSQDAGSYYVFQQPMGGQWIAYAAGNTGQSTPCPTTVPPAVLAVWGWPMGGCRPSGA
jgi:hypothetical protein